MGLAKNIIKCCLIVKNKIVKGAHTHINKCLGF